MLVDVLGVFPKGLYLNELIKVTRGELHWECDYEREAQVQREYRANLATAPGKFYTPKVVDHLSTRELLCTEFVEGVEIDTFMNES